LRIWLDLANSPQVLFFGPILTELDGRGHEVEVTSRAYAQTTHLADQLKIRHQTIGGHGGRRLLSLLSQNVARALALIRWARGRRFALAVSHNSYSQAIAAALMRIPFVTLMDYEHQPLNHLCFRLANRVIVPEAFPVESLEKYGARGKSETYPGVKEQIYLSDFEPDPDFLRRESLASDRALVVLRPPAPWTAYHRFENGLFDLVLEKLTGEEEADCLFLPRVPSQAESVRHLSRLKIADRVYDGPNLLHHAQLVVSGGGTMNRESAIIGTPTFTVFKGELGAVDRSLIERGRLQQLQTESDIGKLKIRAADNRKPLLSSTNLLSEVTDQILG